MTVYSKTMAGRMVAFDQQSDLTPAQKNFLKLVDGKTPPEQLVARWHDGPDALQLLQTLEARGLVEVKQVRWLNSASNCAFPSSFSDSSHAQQRRAPPPASKADKPRTSAALDAIKDDMSTFMLTHLPHHAMSVLKEIEDIDSYDRLIMMLTAYANMAHEAGRTGLAHIKSLRAMLEPGFKRTVT